MKHGVGTRMWLVEAHLLTQRQAPLSTVARYPEKALLAQAPEAALQREIAGQRKTAFGIRVGRWVQAISSDSADIQRPWTLEVASATQGSAT